MLDDALEQQWDAYVRSTVENSISLFLTLTSSLLIAYNAALVPLNNPLNSFVENDNERKPMEDKLLQRMFPPSIVIAIIHFLRLRLETPGTDVVTNLFLDETSLHCTTRHRKC